MIQALLLNEDETVLRFVTRTLEETGRFSVQGYVPNGRELFEVVQERDPDVVLLDVELTHTDCLKATRSIMRECPRPIVLLGEARERAFDAIAAGAVTVIPKPARDLEPECVSALLIRALSLASGAEPPARAPAPEPVRAPAPLAPRSGERPALTPLSPEEPVSGSTPVIAIGTSTGGPAALVELLSNLPANPGAPVLIVQHMADDFLGNFCNWLDEQVPQDVVVAMHGDVPRAGFVYVAPPRAHLLIRDGVLVIDHDGPSKHRPSVDVLFRSVALDCASRSVGILLTGMGRDGAEGLFEMRREGAVTLAQDEDSATVHSMPRAAIQRGAVDRIVSLSRLPSAILASLQIQRARAAS